jgi:hypothetical protein
MRAINVAALGVFVSVAAIVVFSQDRAKADAPRPGPPPEGLWIGGPLLPIADEDRNNSRPSIRRLQRSAPSEATAPHRGRHAGHRNN